MSVSETWTEYPMRMVLLTPLIINNGEEFDFLELFPFNKEMALWLNLQKVLSFLPPGKTEILTDLALEGIGLREPDMQKQKLARNLIEPIVKAHLQEVVYRPVKLLDQAFQQLESKPFSECQKIANNPLNGNPYIPGSSIKGALRTAMLEAWRKSLKDDSPSPFIDRGGWRQYKQSKQFEAEIFAPDKNWKNISNDPFKYLKVSDFHFEQKHPKTYLGRLYFNGKPMISSLMTDAPCLPGTDREVTAVGTISISSRAPRQFSIDRIIDAVADFYIANYDQKHPDQKTTVGKDITKQLNEYCRIQTNAPLRLGHYSGIENVTFNTEQDCGINRKINNPDINTEGGNTRCLIENLYPPGYCILQKR